MAMGKEHERGCLSGIWAKTIWVLTLLVLLASCSGGSDPAAVSSFTVGGTVSGLAGSGLVLQNNAGDDLSLSADGTFTFATQVAGGSAYAVTVRTQPTILSQTCTISSGNGTITADVNNVVVSCVTPPARFAYVVNYSGQNVSAYSVDSATGTLAAISGSPFAVEGAWPYPRAIAADPSGRFAYVSNSNNYTISAFTIDAVAGALASAAGSPYTTGAAVPYQIAIDPAGRFAYVGTTGNLLAYSIDAATGALTALAGSPFDAGTMPLFITIHPTGEFAYVTNYTSSAVSAYRVNATTGALSAVTGSPFATGGANPSSIAVDPTGRFAYVTNSNGGSVAAYAIDTATGTLTPVAGSPFAAGGCPMSATVDPTGKFVYVADTGCGGAGSVLAYTLDSATGALTPVTGSPFAAGVGAYSVTVDPTGRYAYVTNLTVGTVSAYTIQTVTGALTPMAGSPFPSVAGSCSMTLVK
jgi:6-phosphogluconolactonase